MFSWISIRGFLRSRVITFSYLECYSEECVAKLFHGVLLEM